MSNTIEVNEEQAINITIEHGYEGNEFETAAWKQRGYLKNNGTLKALIKKLNTIFNKVEIDGSGKKRTYILIDKKETPTEIKHNYKGTLPTDEDEIMKEYIFSRLCVIENEVSNSYIGWSEFFGFFNIEKSYANEMIECIKDLHMGFPTIYNPKEVVDKFFQAIITRNKDVINNSFKRLQKEKRIKVEEIYNFKRVDGDYEQVEQEEYQDAQEHLKEFLETKDVTYYQYSQSIASIHLSKKMKRVLKEVKKELEEHFDIDYFFKTFKVTVLDKTQKQEITNEEFEEAYFQQFIKLTHDRQNREKYMTSISFWQRFYLLNTLTLLNYFEVYDVDEMLADAKKKQGEQTDDYYLDYAIYLSEQKENEKIRRNTFGSI